MFSDSDIDLQKFVKTLPLETKVGQLFVLDINEVELTKETETTLKEHSISNFILMGRNLQSPEQIKKLSKQLTDYSIDWFSGIPPFISIDQECGSIIRMFKGTTIFPGFMTIAATKSLENCELISSLTAEELAYVGINLNYSPVTDVNSDPLNPIIGDRSFGDNPSAVSDYIEAFIKGHKKHGIFSCAKHFPGHGSTIQDSHLELPRVTHSLEKMKEIDLPPFKRAIDSGVEFVMIAHLLTPIDEENPSSISPKVLSYLRHEMGFKGLAITDSMVMKAHDQTKLYEICMKAILAGCDLVCICAGEKAVDDKYPVIKYITEQAKTNKELSKRIDESVLRILEYKQEMVKKQKELKDKHFAINWQKNKEESQKVYEQSITLYKNELNILPLSSETKEKFKKIYVIECDVSQEKYINNYMSETLFENLKELSQDVEMHQIKFHTEILETEKKEIEKALNSSDLKETLFIILPYKTKRTNTPFEVINMIKEVTENVVLVSLSNPYEFMKVKEIKTIIIGYEYSPMSVKTMAKALLGHIECKGVMPFKE